MVPQPKRRNEGRAVDHQGTVLTAVDVERSITKISDELEDLTTALAQQAEDAAMAEATWKKERAKTRTKKRLAGGHGQGGRATEDECDDAAIQAHEAEFVEYLLSEARYAATRDAMFTKRSQIDALRTIAANIRAQS